MGKEILLSCWLACGLAIFGGAMAQDLPSSVKHLSFVEAGNAQGVPVVFIHAFPMNKAMWDSQVEALKSQARVITFDIRGLGQSRSVTPFTLEFVVDDLIALLDHLKIEKAVVCGLSMGGFVALRAATRNPERFKGLVLADTRSEADSDSSKLGRYRALRDIQEKGLQAFNQGFIEKSLSPDTQKEKPDVTKRAQSIANSNSPEGVSSCVLALTSRTDTTADLSKIQVPTMILQGEFDTVVPMAAAQSLNAKIKDSTLHVIPKAGHLSNLENPQAFNERLLQFIKTLP